MLFLRGPGANCEAQAGVGKWNRRVCRRALTLARQDTVADSSATDPTTQMAATSDRILDAILTSLDDDKAEDVVQIDLRGKTTIADHMVVASGRSTRQVSAISEKLTDKLKQELGVLCKSEGKGAGDWVLIDAGDVIVHVFRPEVREFYQLEKMWLSPADAATRQ